MKTDRAGDGAWHNVMRSFGLVSAFQSLPWDSGVAQCSGYYPGSRRRFWKLEVEADGTGHSSRRDVMCSAEGRKEVVKRIIVGQIDDGDASAPFMLFGMEKIVVSDSEIEQISLCNARRVVIVILRAGRGNSY